MNKLPPPLFDVKVGEGGGGPVDHELGTQFILPKDARKYARAHHP